MVVACRYWYELTDGYWGQFMLTQVPHQYPQDLLPVGRHLTSMQNFAGMLEYRSSWVWRDEDSVQSSSGCLVSTGSLPLMIDEHGEPKSLGQYVAGNKVFDTEGDSYMYLLELAARDLQFRGFRDDRVANFRPLVDIRKVMSYLVNFFLTQLLSPFLRALLTYCIFVYCLLTFLFTLPLRGIQRV